jgi:alcohol dehydrogenase
MNAVSPGIDPETSLASFDHSTSTRLVYGFNAVEGLGDFTNELGIQKALLVTDSGIVKAGHAERVRGLLEKVGVQVTIFDQVIENPDTRCVDGCLAVANLAGIDGIIGLGGGSSMDTAKGCNFLLTNGGEMKDYWGVGKAARPMLPLIAIPTTAGTGSECQSFALISDSETHRKMACGDPKAAAKIAILDPSLTISQPKSVTACTGIDAIAHAVETAVTKKRNPMSSMYSREAFKLAATSFQQVIENPSDLAARGRMLLAAAFAGMAIECSMLGAAHSSANPLTAHYGVVHGQAVGMMLPAIVRYNSEDPEAKALYADLASAPELAVASQGLDQAIDSLVNHLENLLKIAGLHSSLSECGVEEMMIPTLAEEASREWTATFNPRKISTGDFTRIYTNVF